MVNRAGFGGMVLLVGLLLATFCSAAGSPTATVDRSEIHAGETFTLILAIEGQLSPVGPDLAPLQPNFEILANRQSSRHSIVNGRRESVTEWQIELAPRHTGVLTIPALEVADGRTEPLSMKVLPASDPSFDTGKRPVYVTAEIDHDSVYVQQQIRLTVRIFQAVELDDMNITEPSFDHAMMRKVSQTRYQQQVGGVPYRVHELIYAIFPQRSGELIIPELLFSARQPTGRRSMFGLDAGVAVRDMTPQFSVEVVPPPDGSASWLPAGSVELRERWQGDTSQLSQGESISRRIELVVDGQPAAHLPELELREPEGARVYADQPQRSDTESDRGVRGSLVQTVAIVPTAAGEINLPALEVQWWNTATGTMETARLPARALHVAAAPTPAQPVPPSMQTQQPAIDPTAAPGPAARLWPWQLATGSLALLWLVTLGLLWWRSRRGMAPGPLAAAADTGMIRRSGAARSENAAWKHFRHAARTNDPAATRQALLKWASLRWPERRFSGLEDVEHQLDDEVLSDAIQQLQAQLYGERTEELTGEPWRGQALIDILGPLRTREPDRHRKSSVLPPLNP